MYPPLEQIPSNQEIYRIFQSEVLRTYGTADNYSGQFSLHSRCLDNDLLEQCGAPEVTF
jgi:hypothetical protein